MRGNRNYFYKVFFCISIYTFYTGWATVQDGEKKILQKFLFLFASFRFSTITIIMQVENLQKIASLDDICMYDTVIQIITCISKK